MTTKALEVPDWVYVGAPVLICQSGGRSNRLFRTRVKSIAKQSFTVEHQDERISLKDFRGRQHGDSWSHWRYFCVAEFSERGQELLNRAARSLAKSKARAACEVWVRDPSEENRLAAIHALQAVAEAP